MVLIKVPQHILQVKMIKFNMIYSKTTTLSEEK